MVSLVDLLDVDDVTEDVPVRGGKVALTCRGLTAHDIATLMLEFEEVRAMMSARDVNALAIMSMAPKAIDTVIAMGTSKIDDDLTELKKAARTLRVQDQVAVITAVLRLTSPEGIVPLAFRAVAAVGLDPVSVFGLQETAPSRDVPGRDPVGRSPLPSNGSSPQDTQSETSGDTLPDSSGSTASSQTDEKSNSDLAA